MTIALLSGLALLLAAALVVVFGLTTHTVRQSERAIIERFQRYVRIGDPGLNWRWRWIERVAGVVDMQIKQLAIPVSTKTSDNVVVNLEIAVHFQAEQSRLQEAFYRAKDPERQISEFVRNVVLTCVPKLTLDAVYGTKDDIAEAVKTGIGEHTEQLGYRIVHTLIGEITLDERVREAMNEKARVQFLRDAAVAKGEADGIIRVAQARAEASAKALQGKGIADERRAIIEGLEESVSHFQRGVGGASAHDVMTLVMLTQYFDTLTQLGKAGTNTIMIPHSPGALADLTAQIRDAMIVAGHATNGTIASSARPSARSGGDGLDRSGDPEALPMAG